MGKCSIKEAFIHIENRGHALWDAYQPLRKGKYLQQRSAAPEKLLMHKKEILKLQGKMKEKGYTIVPVQVYFKGSLVKVQIALAKGKKLYDKRQDIVKRISAEKRSATSKCGIWDDPQKKAEKKIGTGLLTETRECRYNNK